MSASIRPEAQAQTRAMSPADVYAVAEVEKSSYQFPWSIGIFRDCLLAGYHSQVLEVSGVVSGYSIMSVAGTEAHLLNICVHPSCQRLGYGRQLLNSVLLRADELGVEQVFLEVRPSNDIAIALYESVGFKLVGTHLSYYQAVDGRQDAVIYAVSISSIH
ncbi:MAG: ribosomal-protein-alanine N-acetyltransferase [Gammaproteobacteria bacterium]|nr:MAG: ribosomal-protein-alanine N-acetyltransferase [Gammaproteobacteria bacterium]